VGAFSRAPLGPFFKLKHALGDRLEELNARFTAAATASWSRPLAEERTHAVDVAFGQTAFARCLKKNTIAFGGHGARS
jgi:hypothetical protein